MDNLPQAVLLLPGKKWFLRYAFPQPYKAVVGIGCMIVTLRAFTGTAIRTPSSPPLQLYDPFPTPHHSEVE